MPRRYGIWPDYIRSQFIRQIDIHAAILKERLLPAFANIDEEAQRIQDETYERLMSRSLSEDPDIASLAETARDEGVDFLVMMWRMKQAQINLQTVGLSHLFEQQLLEMHRRWLIPVQEDWTIELKIKKTIEELAKDGIQVNTFPSWLKLEELRHVADCAKHGQGRSCDELRKLRPDLLTPPSKKETGGPWPNPDPVVVNPLGGENLYVTVSDFDNYVMSIKSFWSDLAAALPV